MIKCIMFVSRSIPSYKYAHCAFNWYYFAFVLSVGKMILKGQQCLVPIIIT